VRQVIPQPEEDLYRLLASLQRKEFLYEQPAFPEVEYIFKHALTQEVAYNSVLLGRRKTLHEQTGQALEQLFHGRLEDHYSELAHHYDRSDNTQKAVAYLRLAGEQAVQRSANAEAVAHFTSALELLKSLPDTPERTQQELTLQVLLGVPLMAAKGYGVPEVEKAYARARELCQQVGETSQLFPVLWGLCAFYEGQAEYQTARELGEQLFTLAQRAQDQALLVEARYMLGETLLWLGELAPAREHLEQAIALYNPRQHGSLAFLYGGYDPGVACLGDVAMVLWHLGYPDQAVKRAHEALTLAQELPHPLTLTTALIWAAWLHILCREGQAAQERAEAAVTLCTEQGVPFWLAEGTILRGWALAEQGNREEGIVQIRQGLAAYRATGVEMMRSYFLALLGETCGKIGQTEEGLTVLAEALDVVDKTGERFYEAELYRLKGELILKQSSVQKEAEECFGKAIAIARKQQARSLELRATVSLARLWQQQGKTAEAHQMLSEVYNWFTEGFDTKDLQEAKALLDELAEAQ
jgi:predicted ATPase